MKYTRVVLIANLDENRLREDVARILHDSNLPAAEVEKLWTEASEGVTKKFGINNTDPYYAHLVYMDMKTKLVNRLGDTVGPMAKLPLALLRDQLPYM